MVRPSGASRGFKGTGQRPRITVRGARQVTRRARSGEDHRQKRELSPEHRTEAGPPPLGGQAAAARVPAGNHGVSRTPRYSGVSGRFKLVCAKVFNT